MTVKETDVIDANQINSLYINIAKTNKKIKVTEVFLNEFSLHNFFIDKLITEINK